jgi:GntR family transcriptional regulator
MDEPKKYRDIATDLQDKIEAAAELPEKEWSEDTLHPGAKLPSDAELIEIYGASRNTVREAVRLLLTRGLVEKQMGRGTFVVPKIDPFSTVVTPETGFGGFEGAAYASEVTARNRKPDVTTPRVEIQEAPGDVAAALELDGDLTVVIRHQQRFIDRVLWSMQTSAYPMRFVREGATGLLDVKDMPGGVRQYLDNTLGIKEIGSHDSMTVRAPTPGESAAFKIPDDGRVPVFETRQIGVDGEKHPVRLTISIYPADRNQFSMDTGDLAKT